MPYFDRISSKAGTYTSESSSIYGTTLATVTSPNCERTEERRAGTVNASYWRMVKAGMELPPNGYTYEKIRALRNYGAMTIDWHDSYRQKIRKIGYIGPSDGPAEPSVLNLSPAELASLDARAKRGVLLKVKDQKVNLIQAFAEQEQTVKLIGTAAVKIAKTLGRLKKGDLLGAADALGLRLSKRALVSKGLKTKRFKKVPPTNKELSQEWLALQYGWKPLLSDIYGLAELAAQKVSREVVDRVVSSPKITRSVVEKGEAYGWSLSDAKTTEVTVRYVIRYSVSNELAHTVSQMGITNPLMIAWELMPWSFVIDWFIPIGNWINSFDATLGTKFVSGTQTTFVKNSVVRKSSAASFSGAIETRGYLESSVERVYVKRIVLIDFPSLPNPAFKNPLSFLHAANAIALLNQLRKRS